MKLNIKNISEKFTSYDLLNIKKDNDLDYEKIVNYLTSKQNFSEINLENDLFSKKGNGRMNFDIIVGNPPYQLGRKSIFQKFQIIVDNLKPNYSTLIYPGKRWIHMSGKGMEEFGKSLVNDHNLSKLIYYPNSKDIFDCVDVSDGISIVLKDYHNIYEKINYIYRNKDEQILAQYNRTVKTLLALNPKDEKIINKIENFREKNNLKYLNESISEQKFFGFESNFVEKNRNNIKVFNKNYKLLDNEFKILTNDKSGSSGRANWFIIDKKLITKNIDSISKWKVVVSSAHPGGQDNRDNQLEILDNHSVFGRARISLKIFSTQEEALNFYKYAKSNIIKYSLLLTDENLTSFGKNTLDILNYKFNNGLINFNEDIDIQMKKLLNLSDKEYDYILSKIN